MHGRGRTGRGFDTAEPGVMAGQGHEARQQWARCETVGLDASRSSLDELQRTPAPAAGSDDQGWREVYHLASACPIWPGESSWRKCRPGTVTSAWLGQLRQKARSSAEMVPGSAVMNSLGTGLAASHRP